MKGQGIPPADLERIFDKFYRVQAADSRRAGTGLGLAICRGFVEAMGGTIVAGNRQDAAGRRVHDHLSGRRRPRGRQGRGRMIGKAARCMVLVVDDEPAIRRFLRTSLSAQGYQVTEAENGAAALETLRRGSVDILVLDLGLPDIDGLRDHRRAARSRISRADRRAVEPRPTKRGKVKALDLGADDYVTKPFGIDELLARLRAALAPSPAAGGRAAGVPLWRSLPSISCAASLRCAGNEVKLTPREYDLLRLFVAHAGKVLTHRFILREVWGGEGDVQYLRIYIRALRHKIEPDPEQPRIFSPSRGSATACAPRTDRRLP